MEPLSALSHLFTPQESNKHKARILHTPILVLFLALFLLVQRELTYVPLTEPGVLGYASQIPVSEVIKLTNQKRQEAGVGTLKENASLDEAALQKGKDMLAKGYWAHVAPDGTQPWDFFKKVGYKYRYAGENLARDFTNPVSTVDAWMASPSHKDNLLSSRYKEIGVAVVEGSLNGKDATIVVQLFGATAADIPAIPVAAANTNTKAASATAEIAASPEPTVVPTTPPQVASYDEISKLMSNVTSDGSFSVNKWISAGVIAILLGAIVVDATFMWMRRKSRTAASPFAHIAFFGMILALIIVAKAGQIV